MKTTVEKVRSIIETDLSDSDILSYIDGVDTWMDVLYEEVAINAALFTEIQRWFTAHQISFSRERMAESEEAGGAKIVYSGKYGEGLLGTSYGQTAVSLDNTGILDAVTEGLVPITFIAVKS